MKILLKVKKYFIRLLLLVATGFLFHVFWIIYDGTREFTQHAQLGVILGSTVFPDGRISPRLQKRLEEGLKQYLRQRVEKLIVSGGFGREGHWEGTKMREFLISKGVKEEDIITDNYGNTTQLTAINSKKIADSLHFKSVVVISQYFHITRTKMLFRKQGFSEVYGVGTKYAEWRDLYSIPREVVGFYWYLFSI